MSAWTEHVTRWKDCTKCPLCHQRSQICLARGVIPCDVLFIGEAPGASEDALGEPFVGPAGKILDGVIRDAFSDIALCATCGSIRQREDRGWTCQYGDNASTGHGGRSIYYAMTNLVCCFPREAKARGENEPEAAEIRACEPRLIEFVNIARPRLIVCVGGLAKAWIDHEDTIKCVDIIHPAATMVGRMSLAQGQIELRRATVTLHNAVEEVMNLEYPGFRRWENGNNASAEKEWSRKRRYGKLLDEPGGTPF